jgi:hypothetical protein
MVKSLSLIATILGAGLVTAAYLTAGLFWPAGVLILLIAFWIFAFVRRWKWIHTPGLYLVFGFAAAGFFLNLGSAFLFLGAFLALAGWDLADFASRIHLAGPEADTKSLQNRHFLRLGLVLAAGIGLVLVALNLHPRVPLGWAAMLAVLAAWGLGSLIHRLLRGN